MCLKVCDPEKDVILNASLRLRLALSSISPEDTATIDAEAQPVATDLWDRHKVAQIKCSECLSSVDLL